MFPNNNCMMNNMNNNTYINPNMNPTNLINPYLNQGLNPNLNPSFIQSPNMMNYNYNYNNNIMPQNNFQNNNMSNMLMNMYKNNNIQPTFPVTNIQSNINPNNSIYNNAPNNMGQNQNFYAKQKDIKEVLGNNNTIIGQNKQNDPEIKNFLKDVEYIERSEEEVRRNLDKKKTEIYKNDISMFSFSNFVKSPTSYPDNNNKNLTYMTCVIQCLANIRPIAKYYLKEKKYFAKNMNKYPFNYAFSRIISSIYSFPPEEEKQFYNIISMDNFKELVIKNNKTFRGKSTKDAEKFLIYFLDLLDSEVKDNKKQHNKNFNIGDNVNFKEYYKELVESNNSIIFNCFNMILKKDINCPNNHSFTYYQNFLTYQWNFNEYFNKLELNNNNNPTPKYDIHIIDCIKVESEERPNFNVDCPKCKKKLKIGLKNNINISPNYFIFLTGLKENEEIFKKFKNSKSSGERFKFKIDEFLDLSEIITDGNCHKKYQLDAIIAYNFDESDRLNIYYIAYYRCPIDDKHWYKYSQNEFEKTQKDKVLKIYEDYFLFPAILIYRHID